LGDKQGSCDLRYELVQNSKLSEKYAWAGYDTAMKAADKTKFSAIVNRVIEGVINE